MSNSWVERFEFVKIPTAVLLDTNLSAHARLLYAYMLSRAGSRGWFFPDGGQAEMASDLGFSRRKVCLCLKELEGLFVTERTNHYGAVKYILISDAQYAPVPESSARDAQADAQYAPDIQEQMHSMHTQYRRKNSSLERTPSEVIENDEEELIAERSHAVEDFCLSNFRMGHGPDFIKGVTPHLVNELWESYSAHNLTTG